MTGPLASPAEFPIPNDLQGFWQWDKMHCPRPQTELAQELMNVAVSRGFPLPWRSSLARWGFNTARSITMVTWL